MAKHQEMRLHYTTARGTMMMERHLHLFLLLFLLLFVLLFLGN
jgi:hypothetical protein